MLRCLNHHDISKMHTFFFNSFIFHDVFTNMQCAAEIA